MKYCLYQEIFIHFLGNYQTIKFQILHSLILKIKITTMKRLLYLSLQIIVLQLLVQ